MSWWHPSGRDEWVSAALGFGIGVFAMAAILQRPELMRVGLLIMLVGCMGLLRRGR